MSEQVNDNDVIIKMNQAYIEQLSHFHTIQSPRMPKFPVSAYADNEYEIAIEEVMKDYQHVDDYQLTLQFLKGD